MVGRVTKIVAIFLFLDGSYANGADMDGISGLLGLEQGLLLLRDQAPKVEPKAAVDLTGVVPKLSDLDAEAYKKVMKGIAADDTFGKDKKAIKALLTKKLQELTELPEKTVITELIAIMLKEFIENKELDWCACHAIAIRIEYMLRILADFTKAYPGEGERSKVITYTSLASGSLMQDYIMVRLLLALGYENLNVHLVDVLYQEGSLEGWPADPKKAIEGAMRALESFKKLLGKYSSVTIRNFNDIYGYAEQLKAEKQSIDILSMFDTEQAPAQYLKSKHSLFLKENIVSPLVVKYLHRANALVVPKKGETSDLRSLVYLPHYVAGMSGLQRLSIYTNDDQSVLYPIRDGLVVTADYTVMGIYGIIVKAAKTIPYLALDLYVAYLDIVRLLLADDGIAYYTYENPARTSDKIIKREDREAAFSAVISAHVKAYLKSYGYKEL